MTVFDFSISGKSLLQGISLTNLLKLFLGKVPARDTRSILHIVIALILVSNLCRAQNDPGDILIVSDTAFVSVETETLSEAVSTYRKALLGYTRDQHPEEWAMTQYALAQTLDDLGRIVEGEEGAKLLSEAVAAYRQALLVYTRDRYPEDWEMTQHNLGVVFQVLGARIDGPQGVQLLGEAVAVYRQLLPVKTRERNPQSWARIQHNLGIALSDQGERVEGEEKIRLLGEAVIACRQAMLVFTSDKFPKLWADTQNNLGIALSNQGEEVEGEDGVRLLKEAVIAYWQALLIRTPDEDPHTWAMTQNDLGAALRKLSVRTDGDEGVQLLSEAVAAYRKALTVCSPDQLPEDWATTQYNLGIVLQMQGERVEGEKGVQLLNEAGEAFRKVLQLFPDDEYARSGLSSLYHEVLFNFEEAYELDKVWLNKHPGDLMAIGNFAEKCFTTKRFEECQQLIIALLSNEKLNGETRIALRAIDIANLFALNKQNEIPPQLRLLIQAVADQPSDFTVNWRYDGVRHFISEQEQLSVYKDWVEQLFTVMSRKNRDAIIAGLEETSKKFDALR